MSGIRPEQPDRNEGVRYIEIVIRLKPIDASVGAERQPLEPTRDALNDRARGELSDGAPAPVQPEHQDEPVEHAQEQNDRTRLLESRIASDAGRSLEALAREATKQIGDALDKAALHALSSVLTRMERIKDEADARLKKAFKGLRGMWTRYVPTRDEVVKDLVLNALRATILYVVWNVL